MKECPQCHRCYTDQNSNCNEDGKGLVASIPGEPVINGRYQLEKRLGQGSLGIVFKAQHHVLKTTDAIKIVTPDLAVSDPAFAQRFRQELGSAFGIRHQNLVAITDFGLIENSIAFLAMELVEGQTLAELISREQPMNPLWALEILSAIAAGLAVAHDKGVAHGNLKPENIILKDFSSISTLKILDLGLATLRRKDWSSAVDQQQDAFLASAFYRAPELWFEDRPDVRSDVYSLGAILYKLLAGVAPFNGDSIEEVRRKVLTEKIPGFNSLGIRVSPQLESVVFAAMATDRNDRTPSVEDFLRDTRRAIDPLTKRRVGPPIFSGGDGISVELDKSWEEPGKNFQLLNDESRPGTHADSPEPAPVASERTFDKVLWNESSGSSEPIVDVGSTPKPIVDENVQFTVYRPRAVEPEVSYSILVYAHLAERAPDAPADSPEPRELVEEKAEEALGTAFHGYADTVEDSQLAIPRKGVLTFVPDFPGLTLAPPQHMLVWRGPVHELEFTFTAGRELEGRTVRGNVRVYLGAIVLAELNIAINVNTAKARQLAAERRQPDPMPTYRKIFASYSHRDEAIVQQFEQLVDAFGDKYLRDVRDIRAGEKWNDRLQELIRDADVFQLFWSRNSMKSEFVKDEWNYALSLNKPNFIRPTFWEEPMPEDKQAGLPPAALLELQFKRVPIFTVPGAPQTTPGYQSSVPQPAAEALPSPAVPAPPAAPGPPMRSLPKPAPPKAEASELPKEAQTPQVVESTRTFTIRTTTGARLKTDNNGHTEATFTVTNNMNRPVRGRATAKAFEHTKQTWLNIMGEAERDFLPGGTQQFVVTFDLPIAGSVEAMDLDDAFGFRFDFASMTNPDEDFVEGPIIGVEVPETKLLMKRARFPIWILIPLAGVVALLLWFFLRSFI